MRSLIRVCSGKVSALGVALAAAGVLVLSGCGGGDSVIAGAGTGTITGQFVDATVVGLGYKCGASTTLSGTTNANGEFTCKTGEAVAFYVGGIKLGSVAAAQAVVTPLDLVGAGATPANQTVNNIVRFLMSISTIAADNSTLTIDPAVVTAAAAKTVDFTNVVDADLVAVIGQVKPGATVATNQQATDHMSNSVFGLFSGAYSGSFAGSFSGTWSISISSTGVVTGTATDSTGGVGQVAGNMATTMGTGSTFSFSGTGGGTPWTGTLNVLTKQFSGTWDDGAGSKGTFTGTGSAAAASAPAQTTPTTPSTATNNVTFSTAFNGQTGVTAALSGGALQVSNAAGVNTHSGSWGTFQTAQITVNHYLSTGAEYLTVAAQGGNNMAYLNLPSPRNCYLSGGTPTCASVNIAFDKAAGKITFTGAPMDNTMTLTGSLSFPAF